MNTRRQIIRGAVSSGGGVAFSIVALLVVGKVAATHLSPAELAVFALLLLSADFLNLLSNLGLTPTTAKLIGAAIGDPEKRRVISTGLFGQLGMSFAFAAIVIGTRYWLPDGFPTDAKWQRMMPYFWLLPPLFVVGTLRDLAMAALAGFNRYAHRAAGLVITSALQIGLVLTLALTCGASVATLVGALLAAYGAALIFFLAGLRDAFQVRPSPTLYIGHLRLSAPLYANSLTAFFLQRFDTVLLLALLDAPSAAIYEMAKRLPAVLSRVMGAFLVPYLPSVAEFIAKDQRPKASDLLTQAFALTAVAGYSVALGTILVQEHLILLLFSAEFLPTTTVLGLLLGATCLLVQSGIMGQSLLALGHAGLIVAVNVVLAGVGIALNIVLIPRMGMLGAALVGIAIAGASCLLQGCCVRWKGLAPDSWRCLTPTVLFVGAMAAIHVTNFNPWTRIAAFTAFVLLSFRLGAVTVVQVREILTHLVPVARSPRLP